MKSAVIALNLASKLITSIALLGLCVTGLAQGNSLQRMLEMSEHMDRQDSQDFAELIDKAEGCTRARDYACSERNLQSAQPLATTSKQRQQLQQARQSVAAEKAREAEEVRLAEERQREEERRIINERAMAAAAERENSRANTMAAISAALGSVAPRNSLEQTWANQSRDFARIQADANRQRELERQREFNAAQRQRDADRLRQDEVRRARLDTEQAEQERRRQQLATPETQRMAAAMPLPADQRPSNRADPPTTPVIPSAELSRRGPFTCNMRTERVTRAQAGWGDTRAEACIDAQNKLNAYLNLRGPCGPSTVLVNSGTCGECTPMAFQKTMECKIRYSADELRNIDEVRGPASGVSR